MKMHKEHKSELAHICAMESTPIVSPKESRTPSLKGLHRVQKEARTDECGLRSTRIPKPGLRRARHRPSE